MSSTGYLMKHESQSHIYPQRIQTATTTYFFHIFLCYSLYSLFLWLIDTSHNWKAQAVLGLTQSDRR